MIIDEDKIEKVKAAFDWLNPCEKAEFMRANIEWATCKDLQDELEARGIYTKYISKI